MVLFITFIVLAAVALVFLSLAKERTVATDCYDVNHNKIMGVDCEKIEFYGKYSSLANTFGIMGLISFTLSLMLFLKIPWTNSIFTKT